MRAKIILIFSFACLSNIFAQKKENPISIIDTVSCEAYLLKYYYISEKGTEQGNLLTGNKVVLVNDQNKYYFKKLHKHYKKKKQKGDLAYFENIELFDSIQMSSTLLSAHNLLFLFENVNFNTDELHCFQARYITHIFTNRLNPILKTGDTQEIEALMDNYKNGVYFRIERIKLNALVLDIHSEDNCNTCFSIPQREFSFLYHRAPDDRRRNPLLYLDASYPMLYPMEICSYDFKKKNNFRHNPMIISKCKN